VNTVQRNVFIVLKQTWCRRGNCIYFFHYCWFY